MKRTAALLLTLVMLLSLLTACGGSGKGEETAAPPEESVQTPADTPDADAAAMPEETAEPESPQYDDPYDAVKNYWKPEQLT